MMASSHKRAGNGQIAILQLVTSCLIAVGITVFCSGCTIRRFPMVRPVEEQPRTSYSAARAQEHFILARDFERRGNMKKAEHEYENAWQLDPNSAVLKQQLIRSYVESGKFTQALILVKQGKKNGDLTPDEKRIVSTIYVKMGEISQAAEVIESLKDKTGEELYSLGLIYESLGNVDKALQSYYRCYQKNHDAVEVGYKAAKMLLGEKKYDEVEELLRGMQNDHGMQADIFNLRALTLLARGDSTGGLGLLDSALTVDSLHEETLRNKAQYFLIRNNYPGAITCYISLVKSNPAGEVYNRTLAMLYFYNNQYAEAQVLLQLMLEASMDDYELHYLLGLVFTGASKAELACIEFEKSLALQGEYKDAWYELFKLNIKEKNYNEASIVAERFARVLPHEALAWRTKGQVESLKKNFGGAITSFRKSLTFDSLDVYTWFELGSAFERNRENDRAAKAFRKVLSLRPGDPATLNYLGYMWAEQGKNLDTAKVFLEQALRQDPQNGAFLDSYAWVFYQMGRYDSAQVYLLRATERIYDDPVLFQHLGDILVKRNDLPGALAAYYRSLEFNPDERESVRRKIIEIEILLQHQGHATQ